MWERLSFSPCSPQHFSQCPWLTTVASWYPKLWRVGWTVSIHLYHSLGTHPAGIGSNADGANHVAAHRSVWPTMMFRVLMRWV